jgi:hypothetical protein
MPDALYFEDFPLGEVVEYGGEEVLVFSSVVLLARRSEDLESPLAR